ncbi:hypothetical protein ACFQVD_28615 [Streptosporangium amethystogenes subsp. fukuiense]|uniref:Uncharacterized protein n=1 Tax=Streptosporangium amethystogenes subsp. fukuiense TaxID=698418 RepID=A0ABW2T7N3_9ACTN
MKIKATLIGFSAALALAASLTGFSGTAAANPKEPSPSPSSGPADLRPTVEEPRPIPKEAVVVKPAYTG